VSGPTTPAARVRRVLHIARREALEQARQPLMLFVIGLLLAIVMGFSMVTAQLIQHAHDSPDTAQVLSDTIGFDADTARSWMRSLLGVMSFLGFSQYLGVSAVLAGHAMVHERQCGTLTFLLLAPIDRIELVAGKVLGATSWTTLLYLLFVGTASLAASTAGLTAETPWLTPRSAGWWLAFVGAGPLWATANATACVLVSSVSRDVRAAQQGVWFIVFFATLLAGTLLTGSLSQGVPAQLMSILAASATTITLWSLAAVVLSRDISR